MVRSITRMGAVSAVMLAVVGVLALAIPVQGAPAESPSWLDPTLLAAAKNEGTITVYSSINQAESLELWAPFEQASGIKVNYIIAGDPLLMGRIIVEARAGKENWDLIVSTIGDELPRERLAQYEPPQASGLIPAARDPGKRWYGVYANYSAPAYNTQMIKAADLPKTYEDFLKHPEWAGHVGISKDDTQWMAAMVQYYGEAKAKKLLSDIVAKLHPATVNSHIALARAVGAGEYWLALNNAASLTMNVNLTGAPTDFFVIEPVANYFGLESINAKAPHPNAARLAANFLISREGQKGVVDHGRFPTRTDVPTNPVGVLEPFKGKKIIPIHLVIAVGQSMDKMFKDIFNAR